VKKVGIAIVGAGAIGQYHADAIGAIPDAWVPAVYDANPQTARRLAETCGADCAGTLEDLLAREDVHVVSVCTPSGAHAEAAVAAAQAGKHLIVEKPLEVTLDRADRIIQAAEKSGVKLTCVFPLRYMIGPRHVRQACLQGRLGRLTLADAYIKWYRSQEYYAGSWRGTWALDGGGALMNQSIHNIDLLQWLAGPVKMVFGQTDTLVRSIETEDTASAVLRFDNNAMGVIQGATSCWPGDQARVELHGDRGTIVLENGRIVVWQLQGATAEEESRMRSLEEDLGSGASDPKGFSYELHRRQIAEFITAIREGQPAAIDGWEARRSLEIILAIYDSAKSGHPVKLPLTRES
jgi:UDP-N-acetyl-2-amino-2-deoxyglucuronate dehydrogenase